MAYAFTFDASACSGCKACQIACMDKNNLPVGVLWRRVYEVSGGDWTNIGASASGVWEHTVFAYNMSIACNHCIHPKCSGVCPTNAYKQRKDGVVYIDESKCMGCGYCAWACPYNAPRYSSELGHMTKCNFCFDNLDAGLPPACVAACPMRVLELVEVGEQVDENKGLVLWQLPGKEHPFPLPERSRTEPHLAIQPHTGMGNEREKRIANWEEINTRKVKSELPLVFFTLLTQMAAGMAVASLFSGPLSLLLLIVIGGLISAAGLIAFFHLGTPSNAWRAVFHLKKSWLSREILMFGLFGLSVLLCLFLPGMGKLPLAFCGIGLIYSMAKVYRLRSIPAWETHQTLLTFTVSAVVLGGLALEIIDASNFRLLLVGVCVGVALWLSISERNQPHQTAGRLRLGLIVVSFIGVITIFFLPNTVRVWLLVPVFLVVLSEEIIGRWLFYEHLHQRIL